MAKQSSKQLTAIALMAAGAGLGWWGYDMAGSFGSQLGSALGGTSNAVMIRYIGGGICFAAGLFLLLKK